MSRRHAQPLEDSFLVFPQDLRDFNTFCNTDYQAQSLQVHRVDPHETHVEFTGCPKVWRKHARPREDLPGASQSESSALCAEVSRLNVGHGDTRSSSKTAAAIGSSIPTDRQCTQLGCRQPSPQRAASNDWCFLVCNWPKIRVSILHIKSRGCSRLPTDHNIQSTWNYVKGAGKNTRTISNPMGPQNMRIRAVMSIVHAPIDNPRQSTPSPQETNACRLPHFVLCTRGVLGLYFGSCLEDTGSWSRKKLGSFEIGKSKVVTFGHSTM